MTDSPIGPAGEARFTDPTMENRAAPMRRALFGLIGIIHYRPLLRALLLKDLKLKYRGSALGFLWSLLNPLVMLGAYSLAFIHIIYVADRHFVFRVLVGLLAWGFFANSISMATMSVLDNRTLIKGVFFPRTVLPLATVLFNLVQFLLNCTVFVPLMLLLFSVSPGLPMLVFPVFLVLQVAQTLGFAFIIAATTTTFRDVRHLVEVGINVLFWTTPVVYSYRQMPAGPKFGVLLSPATPFVVAYQEIFVYGQWPELYLWAAAVVYAAAILVAGFILFVRREDRFAEQI